MVAMNSQEKADRVLELAQQLTMATNRSSEDVERLLWRLVEHGMLLADRMRELTNKRLVCSPRRAHTYRKRQRA